MGAKAAFYVVWWVSILLTFTLLATGNGRASALFSAFNLLCAGMVIGWHLTGKRRGGDNDAKNR